MQPARKIEPRKIERRVVPVRASRRPGERLARRRAKRTSPRVETTSRQPPLARSAVEFAANMTHQTYTSFADVTELLNGCPACFPGPVPLHSARSDPGPCRTDLRAAACGLGR